ncbi:MAG: lysoplasmalogenase [Pseudoruegeria sp.]
MFVYLLIWASIGLALIYLPRVNAPYSYSRSFNKTLPVVGLILAGVLSDAPIWLLAALTCSALGDWALSRSGDKSFLHGMIAFAMAHIGYIFGMLTLAPVFSVLPVGIVLLLGLSTELWLHPYTDRLQFPVRIYVIIIGAMGAVAVSLPSTYGIAILGAGFFLLSDSLIAIEKFRFKLETSIMSGLIWITYVIAQVLLFYGLRG